MILWLCIIAIISLWWAIAIRSGSLDQAVFAGLGSAGVLLLALWITIALSKSSDCAPMAQPTPAASCTAPLQELPKPLGTS